MAEIQMPQLGETVTEGTITKWLKSVGEEIAEDEAIVEVSTDKVDSEIPSPVSGTLTEIKVQEGETVDVGTVLALVGDGAAAPSGGDDDGGAAEAGGAEEQAQAPAESAVESTGKPEDQGAEAEAKEAEAEAEIDAATEPEAGESGDAAPESSEGERDAAPSPAPPAGGAGEGQVLSPVVRRLIAEHGLDASSIAGTGAGGRITRSDVQGAIESGGTAPAPAPSPEQPAPAAERPAAASAAPTPAARPAPARAGEGDESVPLNNIRRRTAEHMVRSVATSPHAYASMEVDMEGVERVRRAQKQRFRDELGVSLTYLPFVTRALVDALAEFPHVNASVGEGELVVHHDINVGYAVDLDYEGLIVPVVHDAQNLRLPAIARAVADLADRARSRKLSADEITGGTVTITNAGSSGTLVLLPIINQPQVMILSTDGVHRRPVVVTDDEGRESIAIRSVGNLTLGWDHRAFDGAYATNFLRRVVDILETRDWEAEL